MIKIRKGQAPAPLGRRDFNERFMVRFYDPAYRAEVDAIARLEQIAWEAYKEGRKAPITQPAGTGFKDPKYEVSVQWLQTRATACGCTKALEPRLDTVASVDHLRQRAQRRHLPG